MHFALDFFNHFTMGAILMKMAVFFIENAFCVGLLQSLPPQGASAPSAGNNQQPTNTNQQHQQQQKQPQAQHRGVYLPGVSPPSDPLIPVPTTRGMAGTRQEGRTPLLAGERGSRAVTCQLERDSPRVV